MTFNGTITYLKIQSGIQSNEKGNYWTDPHICIQPATFVNSVIHTIYWYPNRC